VTSPGPSGASGRREVVNVQHGHCPSPPPFLPSSSVDPLSFPCFLVAVDPLAATVPPPVTAPVRRFFASPTYVMAWYAKGIRFFLVAVLLLFYAQLQGPREKTRETVAVPLFFFLSRATRHLPCFPPSSSGQKKVTMNQRLLFCRLPAGNGTFCSPSVSMSTKEPEVPARSLSLLAAARLSPPYDFFFLSSLSLFFWRG